MHESRNRNFQFSFVSLQYYLQILHYICITFRPIKLDNSKYFCQIYNLYIRLSLYPSKSFVVVQDIIVLPMSCKYISPSFVTWHKICLFFGESVSESNFVFLRLLLIFLNLKLNQGERIQQRTRQGTTCSFRFEC